MGKKAKAKKKDTTNAGVMGFAAGIMGLIYMPLFFAVIGIGMSYLNKKYEERSLWKLGLFLGLVNLFFGLSAAVLNLTAS
ncbi:MAG: hypothetical protein JXB14_03135 [Candidatus Altiarchaeota archaeon]|nr:hypothetical protein [Candidatus Altiarchaeota archaeon]